MDGDSMVEEEEEEKKKMRESVWVERERRWCLNGGWKEEEDSEKEGEDVEVEGEDFKEEEGKQECFYFVR
jgi:hypothetical protein